MIYLKVSFKKEGRKFRKLIYLLYLPYLTYVYINHIAQKLIIILIRYTLAVNRTIKM